MKNRYLLHNVTQPISHPILVFQKLIKVFMKSIMWSLLSDVNKTVDANWGGGSVWGECVG